MTECALTPSAPVTPRAHETAVWLLMVAVLVGLYAPVVTAHYGYSDDFPLFFSEGNVGVGLLLSAGRPVPALAQHLLYGRIQTLEPLGILRGISVVGILGLATVFFVVARRLTPSPLQRAALALGLATLPSLQSFAAWASCWLYVPAAVGSSMAALMARRAFARADAPWIGRIGLLAAAFLLVLAAVATYQPAAGWFWVVVLVFVLDEQFLRSRQYRRGVGRTVAAGLVFLAACFLVSELYFLLAGIEPSGRWLLLRHPLAKIHALVREQVPLALNLWHLAEPARKGMIIAVATATAAVILFGYMVSCGRCLRSAASGGREDPSRPSLAVRTGLILLALAGSHAHWLVIDENPVNYRLVAALAGSVLVIAFWSVLEGTRLLKPGGRRHAVRTAAAAILVVAVVFLGSRHLQRYWIGPYTTGYRYVLASLRQRWDGNTRRVYVVRQGPHDGILREWIVYDFGRPLTDPSWVPDGLVRAALNELDRSPRSVEITHGTADEPIPRGPGTLVLDMRKLADYRTEP